MKPGREWPGVGTGAVVVKDGRLLMVRRDGAHGAGKWSVPGGWVEMNEDPMRCAEREVLEETGVVVRSVVPRGWTSVTHSEGIHAVTLWVECKHVSGEPQVVEPEKCPEVRWVPFEDVRGLTLVEPFDAWWGTLQTHGPLASVSEAAEIIGVSRQRVWQLAQRTEFPKPLARLAAGPIWDHKEVEHYATTRNKKTGRPSK